MRSRFSALSGGGGVAQHGGHTPILNWQRHAALVYLVYFFDIGHPCYDQLTPVKIRYLLTSIMWPYRGLKSTTHRGHVFFQSWPLTKWWFSIGSRAHVRLTCLKLDRIVWKPGNASPGLKFIQIIIFSSIPIFFFRCCCCCCFVLCL